MRKNRRNTRIIACALLAVIFQFVLVKSVHVYFTHSVHDSGITAQQSLPTPHHSINSADDCPICHFFIAPATAPAQVESTSIVSCVLLALSFSVPQVHLLWQRVNSLRAPPCVSLS